MSSYTKYESRLRKPALLESMENGLRDGKKCLICQCWRNPCSACGSGKNPSPRMSPNGKSAKYLQAAALFNLMPSR